MTAYTVLIALLQDLHDCLYCSRFVTRFTLPLILLSLCYRIYIIAYSVLIVMLQDAERCIFSSAVMTYLVEHYFGNFFPEVLYVLLCGSPIANFELDLKDWLSKLQRLSPNVCILITQVLFTEITFFYILFFD